MRHLALKTTRFTEKGGEKNAQALPSAAIRVPTFTPFLYSLGSEVLKVNCLTSPVEVLSGVSARQSEGQRNRPEQLDDVSDVI